MQAGRLDRRIDIESKVAGQDTYGQPLEQWTKIGERIAASAVAVSGDETFAASQFVGQRVVEFRIRWAERFENLNPLDRVIYPAAESESPTPVSDEQNIYDVKDVREIGRKEGLQIFAVARSEIV